MYLDTREFADNWRDVYRLCTAFIQPRPIALVSSISADGRRNVAPYSFYNMVSANPPVVMFAPSYRRDATGKDTLHNVEATKEFVVATVTENITEQMNDCSFDYPPEIDEFGIAGFTPKPASIVKPALIAESPVNVECVLEDIKRFGDTPGAGSVVFGRIVAVHVDDRILADDKLVDPNKLKAVGRMGRSTYARTTDRFDLPRPTARDTNVG